MTVKQRPRSLHEQVDTFAELDAWLARRIHAFRMDFEEDEVAQSIGLFKQNLSRGRVDAFEQVRFMIREAVADEAAQAHVESIEAAFKSAGYTGDPMLALVERAMDGDR